MCISPVMIKNESAYRRVNQSKTYSMHAVPCGKCYQCRLARGAAWAFRLKEEEKLHSSSIFVTLTVEPGSIKFSPSGKATLCKDDLQKFFKILRVRKKVKVKYYACGEYGTNTARPHYHAIIFGSTHEAIEKAWKHGHCYFGDVSMASISYVVGYMNKPHIKFDDDREKEFSLMSKGLGVSYITDAKVKYHHENMASYLTMEGGQKVAMPRYYRDKIFSASQKEVLALEAELRHNIRREKAELKDGYYKVEHECNEAKKAGIKKQNFNLKSKRKTL